MVRTNSDGQTQARKHTHTHIHRTVVVTTVSCLPQAGSTKMVAAKGSLLSNGQIFQNSQILSTMIILCQLFTTQS